MNTSTISTPEVTNSSTTPREPLPFIRWDSIVKALGHLHDSLTAVMGTDLMCVSHLEVQENIRRAEALMYSKSHKRYEWYQEQLQLMRDTIRMAEEGEELNRRLRNQMLNHMLNACLTRRVALTLCIALGIPFKLENKQILRAIWVVEETTWNSEGKCLPVVIWFNHLSKGNVIELLNGLNPAQINVLKATPQREIHLLTLVEYGFQEISGLYARGLKIRASLDMEEAA